jgi:hypothetical protein
MIGITVPSRIQTGKQPELGRTYTVSGGACVGGGAFLPHSTWITFPQYWHGTSCTPGFNTSGAPQFGHFFEVSFAIEPDHPSILHERSMRIEQTWRSGRSRGGRTLARRPHAHASAKSATSSAK